MRITGRQIRGFVLVFLLFFAFACQTAHAERIDDLKNEKEVLQNDITQLEAKIKEYQSALTNKSAEITSLKNEIFRINTQISKLNLEIKKTENQIYLTRLNIQETQGDIEETELSIDEKHEVLASLLREINKFENERGIEQFLKYGTFTEVVKQISRIDMLQEKMNEVLYDTKVLKDNLETKEVILTENKKDLENKNAQLAEQKYAQQSEKTRKNTVLTVTKGEEEKYKQLLSSVEKEQAVLLERLAKIEDEILISRNFLSYFQAGTIPKPGTKIFVWPENDSVLTQGYGMTKYASRGAYGGKIHNGIDISSGIASPIKSAAGGKVISKGLESCQNYVRPSCNGYWGNWIAIQHPGGLVTLYSHLSKMSLKSIGESIEAGDVIGYEGASGNVTGPHLHFSVYTEFFTYKDPTTGELRISYNAEKTLNPLDYL
jgi:murein DD-endopeptidase MepM/ murein hydrolase activator NlpD